jgi:hypothetical protein
MSGTLARPAQRTRPGVGIGFHDAMLPRALEQQKHRK